MKIAIRLDDGRTFDVLITQDGRGVHWDAYSGQTGQPIATGLSKTHASALTSAAGWFAEEFLSE